MDAAIGHHTKTKKAMHDILDEAKANKEQPDATLYIMPAAGGTPRPTVCNIGSATSWHSWSPNGRWLVFVSKAHSPCTELFLTHVDEQGIDSPPVRLSRFSDKMLAANVPEFINIRLDALTKIQLSDNEASGITSLQ